MTFNLDLYSIHRSNQVLPRLWRMSSWCWPGSATEKGLSASKGWLRRFLLLKLVTVLLFHGTWGAHLPLLVGCMYSLQALMLLHSPHTSTKPSTVLLGQLALADGLVLLNWMLRLGVALTWWWREEESSEIQIGLMKERGPVWWKEAMSVLCQQLLDAHHLASLLLLGLLGLEAMLVSNWPQQTRRFRTSHWAQLSCRLVWGLVMLELIFVLRSEVLQDSRTQTDSSTPENTQNFLYGHLFLTSLPGLSTCLRRTLWLLNLRLHYIFLYGKPKKRRSSFH